MYSPTPDYAWLFFPPPYDFLAPPATFPKPGKVALESVFQSMGVSGCNGLGCASCGGTCGDSGLGQAGTGLFGTGLFVYSDPSTWGVGEYAVIAVGGYLAISMVTDAQSAGKATRKAYRRIRS
jgi:hypothetical protein